MTSTEGRECMACLTRLDADDVKVVGLQTDMGDGIIRIEASWDLCADCRLKLIHAMWDDIWSWRNGRIEELRKIRDEAIEDMICH